MGSDNLHHKRKAKRAKDLSRNLSKRSSYDKVLIVCEGEKTEPNYLKELIDYYEINSANVAIDGSCGSSPKSVLERAVALHAKETRKGDPYDRVYCVFDRDTHETYEQTIASIDAKKPKDTFYAITSVPCFEYWLILHYQFSTKPYRASGSKSAGDRVLDDLKTFIPNYEKGDKNIFLEHKDQTKFAKANAARANEQATKNHTDNPTTNVHDLVDYLQNIKGEN